MFIAKDEQALQLWIAVFQQCLNNTEVTARVSEPSDLADYADLLAQQALARINGFKNAAKGPQLSVASPSDINRVTASGLHIAE